MSIENQEAFMTSLKWNMSDLIERTKIQSYVDNAEPSEAEVVGLIVSKYFKWNGTEIMEAMLSSLEDANFHELRERLLKTYKEWEAEPSVNMEKYKIRQNKKLKKIIKAFGQKAKVGNREGIYSQSGYHVRHNLALFLDDKTQTLYSVPMSMVIK